MATSSKSPGDRDREIGAIVRTLRDARSLTQAELGRLVGTSLQQIQKYEKGTNRIPSSRLEKLSTALQVPISTFFGDQKSGDQPLAPSDRAMRIATTYDQLSAHDQDKVDKIISIFSRG